MGHKFFENNKPDQDVLNGLKTNLLKVEKMYSIKPSKASKAVISLMKEGIESISAIFSKQSLKEKLHEVRPSSADEAQVKSEETISQRLSR